MSVKSASILCRPTLLGSWNVKAPGFVAQEEIEFHPTAQRYEPGAMNVMGIFGMKAAIDLLLGNRNSQRR